MKQFIFFLISIVVMFGCSKQKKDTNTGNKAKLNIIYIKGLSEKEAIFEAGEIFADKFDINVIDFAECYDAFESMKDSSFTADIFMGLDNTFYSKAMQESIFAEHVPKNTRLCESTPGVYKNTLIPYEYSWLAFLYDEATKEVPETFGKMQDGIHKDEFIITNPGTTSLGRLMLLWSIKAFGMNGYGHFWKSIKDNIFTVSETSEEAISMFLAKEAPITLGLSTNDVLDKQRKAFIPKEGGVRFVKSMAIFADSPNTAAAKDFMEIVLAERFQSEIMKHERMFPVNKNVELTAEFIVSPVPIKELGGVYPQKEFEKRLKRWKTIIK
jgi:thiamine transport system substrate-binding protein